MHRMCLFLPHPLGAQWVGAPVGFIHGSRKGASVDPGKGAWMGHHVTLWGPLFFAAANCPWSKSLFLSKFPCLFCDQGGGRGRIEPQRKPVFLLLSKVQYIYFLGFPETDKHT